ncbi:MAG: tetratricopeptide repeat protein, partial [Myxococcales bacterium]|nr:tetratricopeptide repeat protein [Myxococcales bacterium]
PLPPKAIALNRDGAAAMAAGDLETAEARIALALEYNARFTEAWVNLGLIEMMRGNFVGARRDFVRARDLNPDLPAPHHALGLLAERELAGIEAERDYRAALKVDPGFAPARINLARRLFERGALEEAREQFLRATQVTPDVVDGWAGLAETLLRLDRPDEASEALTLARARFGEHPTLVLLEARFLLRRRAFAEAESRLLPLCRSSDASRASAALAWLAIARLGRGDVDGADDSARQALALDSEDHVARYALDAVGRAIRTDRP